VTGVAALSGVATAISRLAADAASPGAGAASGLAEGAGVLIAAVSGVAASTAIAMPGWGRPNSAAAGGAGVAAGAGSAATPGVGGTSAVPGAVSWTVNGLAAPGVAPGVFGRLANSCSKPPSSGVPFAGAAVPSAARIEARPVCAGVWLSAPIMPHRRRAGAGSSRGGDAGGWRRCGVPARPRPNGGCVHRGARPILLSPSRSARRCRLRRGARWR
jgi:hypothetical protein